MAEFFDFMDQAAEAEEVFATRDEAQIHAAGLMPQFDDDTRPVWEGTRDRHSLWGVGNLFVQPELEWLVKPYILERGLTVLYGPPGSGKSLLALDWALKAAEEFTGDPTESGWDVNPSVVYVLAEGRSGFGKRVDAHRAAFNVNPRHGLYFIYGSTDIWGGHSGQGPLMVANALALVQARLVIFDTLSRVTPGADENSQRDMSMVVSFLDEVRERLDCAVLVVHHTNREGKGYRGSSVLEGAADVMLHLKYVAGNKVGRVLTCEKMKDDDPFEPQGFVLAPVKASVVIEPADVGLGIDGKPYTLGGRQLEVLEALALDDVSSTAQVQKRVWGGSGQHAYNTLRRLAELGFVAKTESGDWSLTGKGVEAL